MEGDYMFCLFMLINILVSIKKSKIKRRNKKKINKTFSYTDISIFTGIMYVIYLLREV